MTESKVSVADRELKEAERWLTYLNAFDKGGRFLIEEGLWIGLGVDILMVTGEVHSDNSILFSQREALVALFGTIDAMSTKGIPIMKDINPIGLLNNFVAPLGVLVGLTLPDDGTLTKVVRITVDLEDIGAPKGLLAFVSKVAGVDITEEKLAGVVDAASRLDVKLPAGMKKITMANYYYPALPVQYRVVLALIVPGILRTIFGFLSSAMKLP